MSHTGFHHVAIRAVDFDATVRFYLEGLGCSVHFEFSVPGRIDRAAFLDTGEGRRRRLDEEPTEGALLHFCFRVADVEASYARALAAGAVSRVAPSKRQLGGDPPAEVHIAFVSGPNGEVIEFLKSDQL
jgi:glyoxylase I family protein